MIAVAPSTVVPEIASARAADCGALLDRAALARYVLSRRTPEGGYSYYRTPQWGVEEPNAPDTLAALACLRLLGCTLPAPARTVDWLRTLQDDRGAFATLTVGWAALRALDELDAPPRRSATDWLARRWRPRGARTLGDRRGPRTLRDRRGALVEALQLAELSRLLGAPPPPAAELRLKALIATTKGARGGWVRPGPDLESTAVAVRLTTLVGLAVDRAELSGFVRRCEDEALGFRLTPQGRATSVGALRGGLEVLGRLGQPVRYSAAVAASLRLLQGPSGGLGARHRAIATLQASWQGLEACELLHQSKENCS